MRTIRIGARNNALALAQANAVRTSIELMAPGVKTEAVTSPLNVDDLSKTSMDTMGGKEVPMTTLNNTCWTAILM